MKGKIISWDYLNVWLANEYMCMLATSQYHHRLSSISHVDPANQSQYSHQIKLLYNIHIHEWMSDRCLTPHDHLHGENKVHNIYDNIYIAKT